MNTESKNIILKGMATILLFTAVFIAARQTAVEVSKIAGENEEQFCVVLDAGHGGDDPGKVGINGVLEKELNLQMAEKLKFFLETSDVKVIMTRTTDNGLYDENADSKKVQDMKNRVRIMEEARPDLIVSIHQNSYSAEDVRGAQVFYYTDSVQGQKLADVIQARLVNHLDSSNHRIAKENDSYYLLKKTSRPIVIVECGFLSNPEEADLLCDPLYQERAAWQIHMGIMQYLNSGNS